MRDSLSRHPPGYGRSPPTSESRWRLANQPKGREQITLLRSGLPLCDPFSWPPTNNRTSAFLDHERQQRVDSCAECLLSEPATVADVNCRLSQEVETGSAISDVRPSGATAPLPNRG